jgi:hypothetical protein
MLPDTTPAIADLIYSRADMNTTLPVRELMWGIPGSNRMRAHGRDDLGTAVARAVRSYCPRTKNGRYPIVDLVRPAARIL